MAAEAGNADLVRLLLHWGLDGTVPNNDGKTTPLTTALAAAHHTTIAVLQEYEDSLGASPNPALDTPPATAPDTPPDTPPDICCLPATSATAAAGRMTSTGNRGPSAAMVTPTDVCTSPPTHDSPAYPNVFWILGAPTPETVDVLARTHSEGMVVVMCANVDAYRAAVSVPEPDVHTLPTNFRAHHGPATVKMGHTQIVDADSFKTAQAETSGALVQVLNWVQTHRVPMYFSDVRRALRPTCQRLTPTGTVVASSTMDAVHGETVLPHGNVSLSERVLQHLVVPAFGGVAPVAAAMKGACATRAAHLADVLAVGGAVLMGDVTVWQRMRLATEATVAWTGTIKKANFITEDLCGVAHVRAHFVDDDKGTFRCFRSTDEANGKLVDVLDAHLTPSATVWGRSVVVHDSLLHDVDDLAAIELIRKLSKTCQPVPNYQRIEKIAAGIHTAPQAVCTCLIPPTEPDCLGAGSYIVDHAFDESFLRYLDELYSILPDAVHTKANSHNTRRYLLDINGRCRSAIEHACRRLPELGLSQVYD